MICRQSSMIFSNALKHNDLIFLLHRPNAKLIWKRIPKDIKENHKEIVLAWNVGVKIIQRDWAAIYPMIDSVDWPNHLKNIMSCLKGFHF